MSGNVLRLDATGALSGQLLVTQHLFGESTGPVGVKISRSRPSMNISRVSAFIRGDRHELFQLSDRGVSDCFKFMWLLPCGVGRRSIIPRGKSGGGYRRKVGLPYGCGFRAFSFSFDSE